VLAVEHGEELVHAGNPLARIPQTANIAGVATISALVAPALDGPQSIEMALIENIIREDLGVIEEARTIAALL
jgi:ParB-like chromosome segregation protein Spo0J